VVIRMKSHGEIRSLLQNAPYCPICYHINQEIKRQFRWLFIEYSHSGPYISNLVKGGFCHAHALAIMKSPAGPDMSYCYRILIKSYENRLRKLLTGTISGREKKKQSTLRLFKEADNEQKNSIISRRYCPFCKSQELFEQVAIGRLINALDDPEVRELYVLSPGLCRYHLERTISESNKNVQEFLIKKALDKIREMSGDFDQYFHKLDYRYSKEPKGKEQETWLRAMRFYDSYITHEEEV